jgi:hypothetical protein
LTSALPALPALPILELREGNRKLFLKTKTLNFLCLSFLGKVGKAGGKSVNSYRFAGKTEVKQR